MSICSFLIFVGLYTLYSVPLPLPRKCKGMKAGRIRPSFSFPVHEMVTGFLEKAVVGGQV